MICTTQRSNNELVFSLRGKIACDDRAALHAIFQDVETNKALHPVFDLDDLQILDSFSIGILLLLNDQAASHGDHLVLRHLHDQVESMARLAKLTRVFEIQ